MAPSHRSKTNNYIMSSLVLDILYSMGFLEYSGPKSGDREAVTGSEVFCGDWWE